MKTGFIGLGIMGSRMATNLLNNNHELVVHNRSKEKAAALLELGAEWANSPTDLARQCDVVYTMLSTPEAVREVVSGDDGLLAHLPKNALWVDSSTVNPTFSREMAALAQSHGLRFLDAPVAGTKDPAEQGTLVFFVGGEAADKEQCQPHFDAMGQKAVHLGDHGKGASMKMLINLMLGQSMVAFAEALVLGESMTLPKELVLNILLNTPVVAPFLANVRPRLEGGDTSDPNFPLQWMQKDLQLATQTAYENGVPMPSLNAAKEIFAQAKQAGFSEHDFSAVYAYLKGDRQ